MKERQRKETAEKKVNVRAIDNKEDLQWMLDNKAEYSTAKKKSVAARSAREQAIVDEGDRVKRRMKAFGESDFSNLKFADMKSIIDVVTENQLKTCKE